MDKKWKKLKTTMKEEVRLGKKFLKKAKKEEDFADCLEYKGQISTSEFVVMAMDELDGTEHHDIFDFKRKE
jgi:hypothetical protein